MATRQRQSCLYCGEKASVAREIFHLPRVQSSSYKIEQIPRLAYMSAALQAEARQILDTLASIPFEQCQVIGRDFTNLPPRPGLYAIRHRVIGLLYIGKTKSLRGRFSGGHKAFLWAWLDKYDAEAVRIAIRPLSAWGNPALLSELEAIILRATEPPYNVKIPPET